MDFDDFPMILGNLGVETDHPPKMCAGLVPTVSPTWTAAASKAADFTQLQVVEALPQQRLARVEALRRGDVAVPPHPIIHFAFQ